jgi:Na+/H+ antiporter NhaA
MGVAVPQQPTTSTLRVFFFLYVCFCFAISTVFQAFFVSYLVKRMYERNLETLDELLDSDVVYGIHPFFSIAQDTVSYSELVKFLEHKRLKKKAAIFGNVLKKGNKKRHC